MTSPQTETPPPGALAGFKVVDFSRHMPASYVSWMFGDFGADIVRVEHPREIAKQTIVAGASGETQEQFHRRRALQSHARNKRSLLINPGHPSSRAPLLELISRADILIEDYRPGVLGKMGYGYEEMSTLNPRLVYLSVSFAGQFGPCAGRAGHDPGALALAGALSRLNGTPTPTLPGLQVADVLTGAHATIATLVALQARVATGRGQRIDIGMSDACMPLNLVTMARNPDLSRLEKPGRWHPKGGVWECQDGEYICTTDMETLYWRRFCEVIGHPEFAEMQHAIDRHPEMQQTLKAIFKSKPRDAWVEIFAEADTQAMPVLSLAEAVQHPHNRIRGMVVDVPFGDEMLLHVGAPFRLSETPSRVRFPATLPGAHSAEVLGELGYDEAAIKELRKAGAFDA